MAISSLMRIDLEDIASQSLLIVYLSRHPVEG